MNSTLNHKKLNREFYSGNVLTVAKKLLGKILVKKTNGENFSGIIVEVEAYDGKIDKASHTYIGKTKRNEIMFDEGGYFYVYFTYGVHFCCNIVTGKKNHGTAVLIRAIEPIEGIDKMAMNRYGKTLINEKEKYNLTSGPGKVCRALGINKQHYGIDLTGDKIFLLNQTELKKKKIVIAERIGIKKSTELPWRFYIKDNPFVSKK